MHDPYASAVRLEAAPRNRGGDRGTLPDRSGFLQLVGWELRRGARYRRTFTLLRIGLDPVGPSAPGAGVIDETVATVLNGCLRDVDVVARLTPREFAVLLPETSVALVSPVLERMTGALVATATAERWGVGVSVGAVTWKEADASPEQLLARAEELLASARRDSARLVEHEVLI